MSAPQWNVTGIPSSSWYYLPLTYRCIGTTYISLFSQLGHMLCIQAHPSWWYHQLRLCSPHNHWSSCRCSWAVCPSFRYPSGRNHFQRVQSQNYGRHVHTDGQWGRLSGVKNIPWRYYLVVVVRCHRTPWGVGGGGSCWPPDIRCTENSPLCDPWVSVSPIWSDSMWIREDSDRGIAGRWRECHWLVCTRRPWGQNIGSHSGPLWGETP